MMRNLLLSFKKIGLSLAFLVVMLGVSLEGNGQITLAHFGLNNNLTPDVDNVSGTPSVTQNGLAFSSNNTPCEGSHYLYCTGTGDYLDIFIHTSGYSSITISWQQKNLNNSSGNWRLYGDYNNDGTDDYTNINTTNVTNSCDAVSVTLPSSFNNQSNVRLRLYSNVTSVTYFYIDDITIAGTAIVPGATITETFSYTSSTQTFTVPNCVTSITVEAWGGGGGGFDGGSSGGGKGGGGGAYAKKIVANPSGDYSIVVGAGGAEGQNGSESTFASNLVVADYGRGGTSETNGGGAGGTGNTSYDDYSSGGTGGNGNNSGDVGGGGGGAGGMDGAGINGSNGASNIGGAGGAGDNGSGGAGGVGGNNSAGGAGAANALGGGGGGGGDNATNGGAGGFPGGGGGGGENGGGAGANGQVKVTYVLPNIPTITLSSASASTCYSGASQNVTLTYSGTTGCPDQYDIDFASGIPDVTDASLSGSPITVSIPAGLAAGTYNGTLTVKNSTYGFVSSGYNITVTILPNNTVGPASSTPTICVNTTLTGITYSTTGATGIGSATGLPTGVTASFASNKITISGTPSVVGTFNYSIPLAGGCGTVNATGTITVEPMSVGGTVSGNTTVCSGNNSTTLTLSGQTGNVIKWQSSTVSDFSAAVTDISNTATSLTAANLTTTTYYRAVVQSGVCTSANSSIAAISVVSYPLAPTTTGSQICIGSSATLSASGANSGDRYKWYNAASNGTLLKTSTNNTDNTYTTPVISATTDYWVSIINSNNCEGPRSQVTATFPAVSADSQTQAGNDSWIGYVYDRLDAVAGVPTDANAFTSYYGNITESEIFNESFGGTNFCLPLFASESGRSILTEFFAVKYRMNSSRKGLYVVNLGSDDGSRLSVDGTLVYNNWGQQSFTVKSGVLINLTGTSSLIYDFYESTGGNQIVFQNLTLVLANNLDASTSQELCVGNSGTAISGDVFGTLPSGIALSGTGYQWAYSNSASGPWTDIPGATAATYTPSASVAPLNNPGTYYVIRKAILVSSNNTGVTNYTATNESNAATITVYALPSAPEGSDQTKTYTGIANTTAISATPGADEAIDWYSTVSGGSAVLTGSNSYTPTAVNAGNYTFYAEARNTTTGCKSSSRTPVTLTINKAILTVSAEDKTVTYGDAVPTLTYAISGFVNGETQATAVTGSPALSTDYTSTTQVASSPVTISMLVGTLAANNYSFSFVNGSITINKGTLIITASVQSKTYGATAPLTGVVNMTFTVSGLQNSDAVNGVTLGYSGSPSGDLATATVGSYTITPSAAFFSSGSDSNYNITYNTGTLTVNPKSLTIAAVNQTKTYGTTYTFDTSSPSTDFTVTGLESGDVVSSITMNSLGTAGTASVGGSPYAITPSAASGTGLGNYTIAYTNGELTITKATATAVIVANSKCYDGNATASLSSQTLSGVLFTDVVSLSVASAGFSDALAGNGKTVTATGLSLAGASAGNYQLLATTANTTANIYSIPTVTNSSAITICNGATTNIALTATTESTYSWTIGTITGGITGASAGTGSSISQVLTNPGNSSAGSVQYVVTPTSISGSCGGSPFTITVTVQSINVLVTDISDEIGSDCPDFGDFNPNTASYNPGYSVVKFRVERDLSASAWSFDYNLTGGVVYIGSPEVASATKSIAVGTDSVDMVFYVANTPGAAQNIVFKVVNVSDSNCSNNGINRTVTHTISAMPAIGAFN